jgi:5-methylcytosine-specific restriction endonuclease McrA
MICKVNCFGKRQPKHPAWFREQMHQFYQSKAWKALREQVQNDYRMRCAGCGKLILGRAIVDHITEINPDNHDDEQITLNPANLQLLCHPCHNRKTFGVLEPFDGDLNCRKNVNLF